MASQTCETTLFKTGRQCPQWVDSGHQTKLDPQRWWEPRHDAIFLLGLRGSGNVAASARAAGFTARTAYNQMRKRPGFVQERERAIAEAKPRLEDLLALQSVRWSRAAYDEAFEGEPLDEGDVDRALRTLAYWEREKGRRFRR